MSKNLSKTLLVMVISILTRIIHTTHIKNSIKTLQNLKPNTQFPSEVIFHQKNRKTLAWAFTQTVGVQEQNLRISCSNDFSSWVLVSEANHEATECFITVKASIVSANSFQRGVRGWICGEISGGHEGKSLEVLVTNEKLLCRDE